MRIYKVFVTVEDSLEWARSAERVAAVLAVRNQYYGVISSAPPWGTVIAASRVASNHGLRLIHDYRDPWSLPEPGLMEKMAHPLVWHLNARLESRAIRSADVVVVNTPTVEREMRYRYRCVRFATILNGVDEPFSLPRNVTPGGPFRITYAGTIYLDRDPSVLFRAIAEVVRRHCLTPQGLVVEFIGEASHYHETPIERIARDNGLGEYLRVRKALPRPALHQELGRASMLVSLPQSTPWSIPSKIYEYTGFDAWMLVFAAPGSATAEILEGSDVYVLSPDDVAGTVDLITQCDEAHRRGIVPDRTRDRERYSRDRRGAELSSLLRTLGWVPELDEGHGHS